MTNEDYVTRLVDEDALRSHFETELGAATAFEIEHHPEGHSNETLFVTWDERELVVRRPPPGETADSAHDVLREYQVIDALQHTDIPLPDAVLACADHSIIGSDFYVVEALEGDVLRDVEPDRFATPSQRQQIGAELVETLSQVHSVDYDTVGLRDFGHPVGFTERQVERWTSQLEWAFERTSDIRTVPTLLEVGDWLAANVPDSHPQTLVHGDYKLDNVMFGPDTTPEITGVFDWELSTIGDPLTDLGWMLFFWHTDESTARPLPELQPSFLSRDGYQTRRELVDLYETRSDITFKNPRFYLVLAAYKMAGLGEMFFRRHLEDNSDDPLYPRMEDRVPKLASYAQDLIESEALL